MPTLQQLRKRRFKSVRAFAEAIGVTPSKASQWLRGQDPSMLYDPAGEAKVIALLGITREEYLEAIIETDREEEAKWRIKHPPLTPEEKAQKEVELKAWCDAMWEKMSEAERQRVHEQAVALGFRQKQRSPIEILVDQAIRKESEKNTHD